MEHFTSTFTAADGNERFYQNWRPQGYPSGILVITHGYAEHSSRYRHVGEYFSEKGYSVWAFDLYGHGRSGGLRADVPRFELFVEDLKEFIAIAKEKESSDIPYFLLGHSMGGAIATLYAMTDQENLSGLILSGSAVKVGDSVSFFVKLLSSLIAALTPAAPIVVFDSETISRNPEVIRLYKTDPLTYNGKVRARMGRELMRVESLITPQSLSQITLPTLILHGGSDSIISTACSRLIHNGISSANKELKIFDGLYHEILNEPEQEGVMKLIYNWMQSITTPSEG